MSINIGNNNKIKKTIIAENSKNIDKKSKKSWYEKHPVIISIFVAVVAGVILKFTMWDELVKMIQTLFGGL